MGRIEKLAGNFTQAEIDEEIILMRLDTGELLSLTDTAAAIWRLIDGERDRPALVAALQVEFDAGEEEIGRDLDRLIAQLREAGLIAGA